MSEPMNEFDPRHPHEPEIPPSLAEDGHCRVCRLIVERDESRTERDQLKARLGAIRRCWQDGIGDLCNPWRLKMAELVGDVEGIADANT